MPIKSIRERHNPPGGRVECEPHQMALCMVVNGIAHSERLNPPSSGNGKALVNWALSRITGASRSASAAVPGVGLEILKEGKFKRAGGTVVTFALPDSIRTAVAKLGSKSKPRARLKQY